jgi:hypothetical protein
MFHVKQMREAGADFMFHVKQSGTSRVAFDFAWAPPYIRRNVQFRG